MATAYVILEGDSYEEAGGTTLYEEVGRVEASSSEVACRKFAETQDDFEGGTFHAIPERSWKTGRHTLKAETTRRIRSA